MKIQNGKYKIWKINKKKMVCEYVPIENKIENEIYYDKDEYEDEDEYEEQMLIQIDNKKDDIYKQ